jgi:hypothetical protein
MATLLLELVGNPTFNRTIWPPHVLIYDDLLIYKKRRFFVFREITISYNQIARVTLTNGIFFAHLEIETTGADKIIVKFISKKKGRYAKSIVDQKIYRSHAKHNPIQEQTTSLVGSYEKSLSRLGELVSKGIISKAQYQRKKHDLLRYLD